jgi:hypothetical protein
MSMMSSSSIRSSADVDDADWWLNERWRTAERLRPVGTHERPYLWENYLQHLLLAEQLVDGFDAKAVVADALTAGLILNAVSPTSIRFAPPLIVTRAEIDEAIDILAAVLAEHGGKP